MLARDVELVIADEPTANLDSTLVDEVVGLLGQLAKKVPVVVVTHDPRVAEACDRTIVLQAAVQPQAHSTSAEAAKTNSRRHRGAALWVVVAVVVAAAGVGALYVLTHKAGAKPGHIAPSTHPTVVQAPAPDIAAFLLKNYRVVKVLTAPMDGGPVPDEAVLSEGPPSPRMAGFVSYQQDVQILAWDPVAKRWNLAFDARKVPQLGGSSADTTNAWPFVSLGSYAGSPQMLLDKGLADQVEQFQTADLGPAVGEVLVFTADVNAGANAPSELAVVGFEQGVAQVEYCWAGEIPPKFKVLGRSSNQSIRVTAGLISPVDGMIDPSREYHFVLKSVQGQIQAVHDDRPWLGAYVVGVATPGSSSSLPESLEVAQTVPGSPAAEDPSSEET